MKILITGANGFIGQKLIQDLKSFSAADVYSLSRKTVSSDSGYWIVGDVLDAESVDAIFREHCFDVVVHLAAITAHDDIVNHRYSTFDTNLKGTINLLSSFNRYCKNSFFLYASTGKVYGKTNEMPISETAVTNPKNILGKSKRITEEVIDFYAVPQNKYLVCRIFNIYGEAQKRSFVVPTIIDQLREKEITLGSIRDFRDYLYIDDLSSALISCISHREKFAPVDYVNIGSGEPACVMDIIHEMEELLERKIVVRVDESRMRVDETPVEFCDHSKLTSLTGWEPSYSLKSGLQKTLVAEGVL